VIKPFNLLLGRINVPEARYRLSFREPSIKLKRIRKRLEKVQVLVILSPPTVISRRSINLKDTQTNLELNRRGHILFKLHEHRVDRIKLAASLRVGEDLVRLLDALEERIVVCVLAHPVEEDGRSGGCGVRP
jgi:hypothetical protein